MGIEHTLLDLQTNPAAYQLGILLTGAAFLPHPLTPSLSFPFPLAPFCLLVRKE